LTLNPTHRISARDALDSDYFWEEPIPCSPQDLPKYEPSHEFQTRKRRQDCTSNESKKVASQVAPNKKASKTVSSIQNLQNSLGIEHRLTPNERKNDAEHVYDERIVSKYGYNGPQLPGSLSTTLTSGAGWTAPCPQNDETSDVIR